MAREEIVEKDHRRDLTMLRARVADANVKAALAILDRAPDVPPDEGDEPLDSSKPLRRKPRRAPRRQT